MHERRFLIVLAVIVLICFTLATTLPVSKALPASNTNSQTITVIVSRNGFNGTADTLTITVQQGQLVNITFVYGDGTLSYDNPHRISFEHYGIRTTTIGRTNPTASVVFVADTAGSFNFYCDIPCQGMEDLLGHLVVTATSTGTTASTLELASSAGASSNAFFISATVVNTAGEPIPGANVRFYENTTFGELFLGNAVTNSQGVAVLNYTAPRVGDIQIIAETPGSTPKTLTITILASQIGTTEGNVYLGIKPASTAHGIFYGISYPANFAMIAVPRMMNIAIVMLVGFVILSVWSTYGYILRQLSKLARDRPSPIQEALAPFPDPIASIGAHPPEQTPYAPMKTVALLYLTPLLGVGDVMLLNSLRIPLVWNIIALLGLALIETAAIVAAASSQHHTE